MKPLYTPLTHAYGFPKTTARTIIHAPIQYAGISLHHIYDLQGHEKLKFFLLHIRRFDYTGKLMFMCLQWIQLWIGIELPFINQSYDEYKHLVPFRMDHKSMGIHVITPNTPRHNKTVHTTTPKNQRRLPHGYHQLSLYTPTGNKT